MFGDRNTSHQARLPSAMLGWFLATGLTMFLILAIVNLEWWSLLLLAGIVWAVSS